MKRLLAVVLTALWGIGSLFAQERIVVGDERLSEYIPLLQGKRVGVLANHTSVVDGVHLVDMLLNYGVEVTMIFAPEHGFRGTKSAGEHIDSSRDAYTGIEIISLYGSSRTPKANDVFRCDVILVDIQDVGLRYYTYLSSLYLMMQPCADVGVPMIILDRPNPNGMYVDGPIIREEYRSFVGMIPVPVVHGMTFGELAQMINGEGWLEEGRKCRVTVIPCEGYRRSMRYTPSIAPSPNLPSALAIALYPSLCYFEATTLSIGRGTDFPFQVVGHPALQTDFEFTPEDREGAKNPPQEGKLCRGYDLRDEDIESVIEGGIDLSLLVKTYEELTAKGEKFFLSGFFEKLIGVGYVRDMIIQGYSADDIKTMWIHEVEDFCLQREKYLIYEE
jgi:uncharacterized protein YbbC (DUF1343 family)